MLRWVVAIAVCLAFVFAVAGIASAKMLPNKYVVTNLVSDTTSVPALFTDPNLVNGWGLAAGPTTPWWVADNGTDKSTLYDASGTIVPRVFSVPGGPTGLVFNGTTSFVVATTMPPSPEATSAARFLFATEAGTILGWNPNVPSAGSTQAVVAVDRSGVGAVYKGLAIGSSGGKDLLYATDFHNGRVDVFDGSFALQTMPAGAFVDRRIPKGYAPFGIQNIGGHIFVTYAKQDRARHDEVDGQGFGYFVEYGADGRLLRRITGHGMLNAPWGLAKAPAGFGRFSGHLLVGNFGGHTIEAYRATRHGWVPAGSVLRANGHKLRIDGLWGIAFGKGSGTASGPANTLFFAAGPNDESHGLFGSIKAK